MINNEATSEQRAKPASSKTKTPRDKKDDHNEVGGHKLWVVLILAATVILSLFFAAKSRQLGQSAPSFNLKLPQVNLNLFGTRIYDF